MEVTAGTWLVIGKEMVDCGSRVGGCTITSSDSPTAAPAGTRGELVTGAIFGSTAFISSRFVSFHKQGIMTNLVIHNGPATPMPASFGTAAVERPCGSGIGWSFRRYQSMAKSKPC